MPKFYINTDIGCGIREAADIQQARAIARREVGELVRVVRLATAHDIAWVKAMGGRVPEEVTDGPAT